MIIRSMSPQNKVWAACHIKIVETALDVSNRVLQTMDSLYKENLFETNCEGSRYDAFRHVFWTYSLASEIGVKAARRIGTIYEDYNEYVFSTKPLSGYDLAGRQMDEYNNEVGLHLYSKIGKRENDMVFAQIKDLIAKGYVKIIAKDSIKRSLDRNNNVIQDSVWQSKWNNDRYLINSNVKL